MKKKILKLQSDLHNIDIADKIIEDISEDIVLNDEVYGNIVLSISEALSNAIIHGNKFDKNKFVYVEYEYDNNSIVITVKDEGEGFDPNNLPDPTDPENIEKLHSRGIFILKHICDDIKFEYQNGQKVIMTFKLK